jgi:hypothetical protein
VVAAQPLGGGLSHHLRSLALERRRHFFMLTSRSDGIRTQTGLPSTSAMRLEEAARLDADRLSGLHADAFCIGIILVSMNREFDASLASQRSRACSST